MATMTITIPDDKLSELLNYFALVYPIPEDQDTGLPLYSKVQWAKIKVYDFIRLTHFRGKRQTAIAALSLVPDDAIATVT